MVSAVSMGLALGNMLYMYLMINEKAQRWLRTEEYDFRERELMTKTEAIKLAGRKAVEEALQLGVN